MCFFAIYFLNEENKGSVSDRLGMCIIFCVSLYLYCKAVTSLKLVRKKQSQGFLDHCACKDSVESQGADFSRERIWFFLFIVTLSFVPEIKDNSFYPFHNSYFRIFYVLII